MAPPRMSMSSMAAPPTAPGESSPQESEARKRVTKACDRCRLKKIKCDGQMPCSRCSVENSICRYGERKATTERRIPPGYVEYLEEQQQLLVRALKKSYAMTELSQSLSGDDPPVHTILENLGVFADAPTRLPQESAFYFEEDLEALREKCEAEAVTGSSASTRDSQVVSAHPTPARLSPESENTGYPFPQSRSRTWSPARQLQPSPPQPGARQQPSPAVAPGQPVYLPQNASAPSSLYESSAADLFPGPHWQQQTSMPQVHSEPSLTAPMSYWPNPQQPQQWPPPQSRPEQQYGTVDPATLMLAPPNEAYLQTAEAWAEYYREQQQRQR